MRPPVTVFAVIRDRWSPIRLSRLPRDENDEIGVRVRFFIRVVAAQRHVREPGELEPADELVREVHRHFQDVLLRCHVLAVAPHVGPHLERHALGQRIELDDPAAQFVFRSVGALPPIAVPELVYMSAQIWSEQVNVPEMMIVLLISYIAMVGVINQLMQWLEQRLRVPGFGQ